MTAPKSSPPPDPRRCPRCDAPKSKRAKMCHPCWSTIQTKRRLARAGAPLNKLVPWS